jgi:hypothetical protein
MRAAWLPAIALLCLGMTACASSSQRRATVGTVAAEAMPVERTITGDYDNDDYGTSASSYGDADNDDHKATDRDNDSDNSTGSYYDSDDDALRYFGHAADSVDRRDIAALIERYYSQAVAQDGAAGCTMIVSGIAKSVPEDIGRPPGPPYLRGDTCAVVLSKVFKENRRQLMAYAASLRVTGVRVLGGRAVAILGFRALPGRDFHLLREGGAWKLESLLDGELP